MEDKEKEKKERTSVCNSKHASSSKSSESSSKHTSSSKCSVSSAAAKARAAAEAARAKVAFAQRELELKKQRAKLDLEKATLEADLEVLGVEKEAAAANAEAEVLEAAAAAECEDGRSSSSRSSVSPLTTKQRMEAYLEDQAQVSFNLTKLSPDTSSSPHNKESSSLIKKEIPEVGPNISHDASARQPSRHVQTSEQHPLSHHYPSSCNQSFHSAQQEQNLPVSHSNPHLGNITQYTPSLPAANMMDFAIYLARRDLITTGLTKFDDRAESYRAWQSSFFNATQGLQLTPSEELDLLIKWLGRESSEHVKRIRAVHIANPAAALQLSWTRLQECYATPEVIESALFKRLDSFPRLSLRENIKLRELSDLLMELLSAKDDGYLPGLSYLDTPRGINPIVEKLPTNLQEKWLSVGSKYKEQNRVCFPPFSFFVNFVSSEAKARNDPSFGLINSGRFQYRNDKPTTKQDGVRTAIAVHKTEVSSANETGTDKKYGSDPAKYCPLHNKSHPLEKCRAFKMKPLSERKRLLKEHKRCFKCCSATHVARECQVEIKCSDCESDRHCTALHPDAISSSPMPFMTELDTEQQKMPPQEVTSRCTEVCGEGLPARSCAKICLVRVFPKGQRERSVKMYAILDDQSNRSLARSEFFQLFGIFGDLSPYLLRTCAGTTEMSGRKAVGFQIEAMNGEVCLDLPPLIECNEIMTNRSEIPAPEVALSHAHLRTVAPFIPKLDPEAQILILLGRDLIRVHKVRQQINGPHNAPFAQRLDLGWVIIGEVCINSAHKPTVAVYKTNILQNGRPSLLTPCQNHIRVKERMSHGGEPSLGISSCLNRCGNVADADDKLGLNVFARAENDNEPALSFEDEAFLNTMQTEFVKGERDNWVAPLPFKSPRPRLPNNRAQALSRLHSLGRTLTKNPEMKEQFITFMRKLFENEHAEIAPPLKQDEECWYLPIFGVYHPQKPGQIRVVFDSSAQEGGISLNNVLLSGPDLNNTLLGVLLRFRKEPVAITADIQQMFYGFFVSEHHRNYLRFLWYKNNDPTKEVMEYRMRVHVFGNSPSPAVAIYGLRKAAQEGERKYGSDTRCFVERHFYVDDGLISLPTEAEAIDLLKRTQASLAESNLRLHKFASNSVKVMQAFGPGDLATGLKDLSLGEEALPLQRSLGLCWNIESDTFTFRVAVSDKPFTRRGVLSTVNSIFDPLGLVAPVTIRGRALLRELSTDVHDWDTELPPDKTKDWETWRRSLQDLSSLQLSRSYTEQPLSSATYTELCLFSDASNWAIGAVAYLKVITTDGQCQVGFVLGKAKLAPKPEPTVPRLELCGAVLAVEMAELILKELDHKPNAVTFYCDSKVVLGYIYNDSKRFFVYVHNRVHRIRQSTSPQQWHYVPTDQNPADLATRSVSASHLTGTMWFTGPRFLLKHPQPEKQESFELVDPEKDVDVRPQVTTCATRICESGLTSKRFQRFSTWESLLRGVSLLIHQCRSYKSNSSETCKRWHQCNKLRSPGELEAAKLVILRSIQKDAYPEEWAALSDNRAIPRSSAILNLDPFMCEGLLRVGGRLKHSSASSGMKNPIILPKENHVTKLLVSHYHTQVKHQGRLFTEGAIRAAGLWIVAGKRLINSVVHHCVICRKLRGKLEIQKMADLPPERLTQSPPFTYVGLDVFGPWEVVIRRTRGVAARGKRWAILFTCMSTRAVHIEVIESMDSSACINALRRLFALRGPAKQLRSDRGTNFIGACSELGVRQDNPHQTNILRYLHETGCSWEFNPPHASHMGGVWERMIGVTRRILDSMLLQAKHTHLTHEVLCTFMAEASAIINARPLVPISSDPSSPLLLTPAMLVTQKSSVPAPAGDFSGKDLFKCQWKRVQTLADEFWTRWRNEYLHTLQPRRKWHTTCRNLQVGDIVLLKQSQSPRNEWPMGLITSTFPSGDGKVRKVEVRMRLQGKVKTFLRPISDAVLLLPNDKQDP